MGVARGSGFSAPEMGRRMAVFDAASGEFGVTCTHRHNLERSGMASRRGRATAALLRTLSGCRAIYRRSRYLSEYRYSLHVGPLQKRVAQLQGESSADIWALGPEGPELQIASGNSVNFRGRLQPLPSKKLL